MKLDPSALCRRAVENMMIQHRMSQYAVAGYLSCSESTVKRLLAKKDVRLTPDQFVKLVTAGGMAIREIEKDGP